MSGRRIEMSGKRFGRLLVLRAAAKKNEQISWECRCDCGSVCEVLGWSLRSGRTRSCGCIKGGRNKSLHYQLSFVCTTEHGEKIKAEAERLGISVAELLRRAVEAYGVI